eukprot:scaffold122_cov236-Pinguiococcus_pyrenoidosus.AAC.16
MSTGPPQHLDSGSAGTAPSFQLPDDTNPVPLPSDTLRLPPLRRGASVNNDVTESSPVALRPPHREFPAPPALEPDATRPRSLSCSRAQLQKPVVYGEWAGGEAVWRALVCPSPPEMGLGKVAKGKGRRFLMRALPADAVPQPNRRDGEHPKTQRSRRWRVSVPCFRARRQRVTAHTKSSRTAPMGLRAIGASEWTCGRNASLAQAKRSRNETFRSYPTRIERVHEASIR